MTFELDLGFVICMALDTIGVLEVKRSSLIHNVEASAAATPSRQIA